MVKNNRRKGKPTNLWDVLKWVLLWIGIAMAVCFGIKQQLGAERALEFLGGYLIELSLSMDNLFVFMSIFTGFGVAERARHRVLHWGIMGAVILRLLFIMAGVAAVQRFGWILYLFGALLIVNGLKMFSGEKNDSDVKEGGIVRLLRKVLPMTEHFEGEHFIVQQWSEHKKRKRWYATPLLGVLVIIECSDIIFAIDSVPAVFSVSTHPMIIYISNILAILGLRQLYFVLEYIAGRFCYVKYGVAVILIFTGGKMLAVIFGIHISTATSILFIFSVLLCSIVGSMLLTKNRHISVSGER